METKTTVKGLYCAKYSGEELARLMKLYGSDALDVFDKICERVQKAFDFPEGADETEKLLREMLEIPPMTEEEAADNVHCCVLEAIRRKYFADMSREEAVALANILYKHGGALTVCPSFAEKICENTSCWTPAPCGLETTYSDPHRIANEWGESHPGEAPIKAPDEDFFM